VKVARLIREKYTRIKSLKDIKDTKYAGLLISRKPVAGIISSKMNLCLILGLSVRTLLALCRFMK